MKKRWGFLLVVSILVILIFILVFNYNEKNNGNEEYDSQIPNPAAVYCLEQGNKYEIKTNEQGQYGVCKLLNGTETDAWEYFRNREK